ncbi:MAG TPA: SRPBCC domain-containing protein [Caulobacter sp.]|nr:SRPBCC domain-containing protein [Caulobacter sp.]
MKRVLPAAVAALSLTLAGAATAAEPTFPDWRQYRDVANSSYVEPDGDKVLQLSIVVKATPAQVWRAFTTGEGYREWVAPVARIDLAVDGIIEASYDANAQIGDPDNIKNRIVAFVPERMLSIRNVQAPKALPHRDLFPRISTTIEFEDLGLGRTRVVLTAVGYGPGAGFDTLYRHFEWGNAYTLNELKKRFDTGPVDWAAVAERRKAAAASAVVTGGGTTK